MRYAPRTLRKAFLNAPAVSLGVLLTLSWGPASHLVSVHEHPAETDSNGAVKISLVIHAGMAASMHAKKQSNARPEKQTKQSKEQRNRIQRPISGDVEVPPAPRFAPLASGDAQAPVWQDVFLGFARPEHATPACRPWRDPLLSSSDPTVQRVHLRARQCPTRGPPLA